MIGKCRVCKTPVDGGCIIERGVKLGCGHKTPVRLDYCSWKCCAVEQIDEGMCGQCLAECITG